MKTLVLMLLIKNLHVSNDTIIVKKDSIPNFNKLECKIVRHKIIIKGDTLFFKDVVCVVK